MKTYSCHDLNPYRNSQVKHSAFLERPYTHVSVRKLYYIGRPVLYAHAMQSPCYQKVLRTNHLIKLMAHLSLSGKARTCSASHADHTTSVADTLNHPLVSAIHAHSNQSEQKKRCRLNQRPKWSSIRPKTTSSAWTTCRNAMVSYVAVRIAQRSLS